MENFGKVFIMAIQSFLIVCFLQFSNGRHFETVRDAQKFMDTSFRDLCVDFRTLIEFLFLQFLMFLKTENFLKFQTNILRQIVVR